MRARIIFITGTDTGVGKTILTALLLSHLRQRGHRAIALKPFCSGSRADVELLRNIQDGELMLDEINPFYFREPLAPLIAARLHRRKINIRDILISIRRVAASLTNPPIQQSMHPAPTVLIEGIGGLLVPLGEGFCVLDVIRRLSCEVILVSANRLGTINHTLMSIRILRAASVKQVKVALMDCCDDSNAKPDTAHNGQILSELLAPMPVLRVPFLGRNASSPQLIRNSAKGLKRILSQTVKRDA
jgi:dethiobiotin synthetase